MINFGLGRSNAKNSTVSDKPVGVYHFSPLIDLHVHWRVLLTTYKYFSSDQVTLVFLNLPKPGVGKPTAVVKVISRLTTSATYKCFRATPLISTIMGPNSTGTLVNKI